MVLPGPGRPSGPEPVAAGEIKRITARRWYKLYGDCAAPHLIPHRAKPNPRTPACGTNCTAIVPNRIGFRRAAKAPFAVWAKRGFEQARIAELEAAAAAVVLHLPTRLL
eukprot:3941009-Rhodomonas_salina.2